MAAIFLTLSSSRSALALSFPHALPQCHRCVDHAGPLVVRKPPSGLLPASHFAGSPLFPTDKKLDGRLYVISNWVIRKNVFLKIFTRDAVSFSRDASHDPLSGFVVTDSEFQVSISSCRSDHVGLSPGGFARHLVLRFLVR